ncbi:MAG: NarK family nitrate/nitrite MFS transporter [Mariprofundales bacterium]|nr:NarK family nitrate/nitrite MFS transporter [Mariprofundales bacterium]
MSTTGVDHSKINLFSFTGKMRTLHITWFAFFISFVVWFNMAPLMVYIREALELSNQQVKLLMILNVALTIPARIVIGMLVDKYGPRIMYSMLLAISSILCLLFAFADSFAAMATLRFLLGFVGAGFVIGIRMVAEWFPAKQVGTAEGIYGGWGNFGSAAAAITMPMVALWFGGVDGWRWALATTGMIALVYSFIFYFSVSNNPKGTTYFRPKQMGAMEVTSRADFYLYCIMTAPLYLTLALLAWKMSPVNLGLFNAMETDIIYLGLAAIYAYQVFHIFRINRVLFAPNAKPVAEIHRYKFKQVAVLDLAYLVTFGSELAVVSMLPLFFYDTFKETEGLSVATAGLLASGYAFMNLVSRPGGGVISDKFGRRKTILVLLTGLAVGYFLMGMIDSRWSLALAVIVTMGCSLFVQAGEGAVFAMVPLVKRRMTGQVAGMVGAYGNVGAVTFLTVLSFVSPQAFFTTIGAVSLVTLVIVFFFLDEPKGHMYEEFEDGRLEKIKL